MTELLERTCECRLATGPLPTLTPEQHVQSLKCLLHACQENIDIWVAKAQLRDPELELGDAVAQVHQHICTLLAGAYATTISATAEPDTNPTQCYNQYEACIAAGTPPATCLSEYELCLGGVG